ncbi:hypothetical protein F5148DRAFT_1187580 [Russula earlei]|uniref:Uncharacterized protein n=1 Tax=Russula earlei TaxID=71964 RepID=A0ACC0UD04_9AGAM|nr:hypothetical protein F5148DRAFT_1187580 [Russula earlei]
MSGTANPSHEVHRGDIPYQAPFARSASPNDSLTTAYGTDDTNLSDAELSEDAFSHKVLTGLRIYEKREEEERAEVRPLIMPRPRRGATATVSAQIEEKAMFDQVMRSLRWHIEELEEEDTIETVLQRRLKNVVETQPSGSELGLIMEGLMG